MLLFRKFCIVSNNSSLQALSLVKHHVYLVDYTGLPGWFAVQAFDYLTSVAQTSKQIPDRCEGF